MVNQREELLSQEEATLINLSGERLQGELDKALASLEDLEELRGAFLGQTGVHIGIRVLKSARFQFEQEENKLKDRIAVLKKLLNADKDSSGRKP